jgi:hypothetical protein
VLPVGKADESRPRRSQTPRLTQSIVH